MINKQIIDLAQKLISIRSEGDDTQALKNALDITKLQLKGFRHKEYKNKGVSSLLFYNTPNIPKKFKLILSAHLDVVPGKPNQYKPRIIGDKLIGRGAYDMKGAAAAEILVFKELANEIFYPLGLQIVTDEEIGGFNGAKYQHTSGVDTEAMLAGECSTDLAIGIRAKGIVWLKINFEGVAAHSAYLWEGKNPIYDISSFLNKLWKEYPIPKQCL